MADPLVKTFETLARSRMQRAIDVLVAALDGPDSVIRDRSAETLMRRGGARGHVEVVRRFEALGPGATELLQRNRMAAGNALDHLLRHGSDEERATAIQVVVAIEDHARVATLLELMRNEDPQRREEMISTIADLVDRLHAHADTQDPGDFVSALGCSTSEAYGGVLDAFLKAIDDEALLPDRGLILEWILILGKPGDFVVRQVVWQSDVETRSMVSRVFASSRHAGVMRLVCESLREKYPHPQVFECLALRSDRRFAEYLLHWLPNRPTESMRRNLEQITEVASLDAYKSWVDEFDTDMQSRLYDLVRLLGIPRDLKDEICEWIVRNGRSGARRSAMAHMDEMDDLAVREVVFAGLDDDDPDVQAWATTQLRARRIPEAIGLLIERLDSPFDEVQTAARDELKSFNVSLLLRMHGFLPEDVCRRAAALMCKIDPDTLNKLKAELTRPVRKTRLTAIKAIVAAGLQLDLASTLLGLLNEEDVIVRRAAAEALADVDRPDVRSALRGLLVDDSARVRDTASRSLAAPATL